MIDCSLLQPVPWKNGGGSTRTIAVWPEGAGFDDFDWRISIADVREPGDFSLFPGVDRTILLLEGGGMILEGGDGGSHALTAPFEPWNLSGDLPVRASLPSGAARDLNVMVRRGRAESRVFVWRQAAAIEGLGGNAVFYCPRGAFGIFVTGEDVEVGAGFAVCAGVGAEEVRIAPRSPDAVLIGVLLTTAV